MTDRTLTRAADLDGLDFERGGGLVPVVAQDAATGEALMLAYADREALERTLETGEMHFHSRSRAEMWRKGETSGNTLAVVSLHADCDGDAVLARVAPAGPACHTLERSCFGEGADAATATLARLDAVLASRAGERPEGSYTVRLLGDRNLRIKKLGEETAELVAALAGGESARAVEEAADLVYHVLVALRGEGLGADTLLKALAKREGARE
jgi:phosphoribosyl-ATP pyrophosphohydrolase/phosphoribosyl-AMP cyclohydrolase